MENKKIEELIYVLDNYTSGIPIAKPDLKSHELPQKITAPTWLERISRNALGLTRQNYTGAAPFTTWLTTTTGHKEYQKALSISQTSLKPEVTREDLKKFLDLFA